MRPERFQMLEIIRITPHLAGLYRDLRLTALKTDPLSFGSTYEGELMLTYADWERRAAALDGHNRVGFFAIADGAPGGLIACFRDPDDGCVGQVISMWVAPAVRRRGVGRQLLHAVRDWAASHDMARLQLLVTSSNAGAILLYRQAGYRETGRTESYPNDPQLVEIEMPRAVKDES